MMKMNTKTKKRFTAILAMFLIALLTLSGCTSGQNNEQNNNQNEVQKVSLQLSIEEYPVMDGSTANLPMMAEIMSRVCDITLEEAEELTSCSKTSRAWMNIANGYSAVSYTHLTLPTMAVV